ncbi:carboxymuconolactone decarboxylase family protein [Methylobacter sp. YRD-M1]|uniref:carboxymuconolactone decarboxylase family protein n=1 Tax=Methylobacter sp. YRD-M1 TaxID=2911520 RepID=UPI00227BF3DD|nr:carboxymuconolactone decarboxylase family protein [Methylobacter sp. YRD-M1]WAK01020.1 carboxymuconolactone decarboxylase family protein [Methylobacter sp. YRD-M1]
MPADYKLKLTAKTIEDAAPKARMGLQQAQEKMGFIPNMYARMANSPGLFDAYQQGYAMFRAESGFTPAEQEVVFLTISRANGCEYCMAAHSFVADKMSNVPGAVTDAIRNDTAIPDERLSALAKFTRVMVEQRGLPQTRDVEAFLAVGYTERQILEIILAIAVKTLSNYANHLFHTPVDAMFASRTWEEPRGTACQNGIVK